MTAGAVAHPSESAASDSRHTGRAVGLGIGVKAIGHIDRQRGFWRQYGLHTALAGVVLAVTLLSGSSLPETRLIQSRDWVVAAAIDVQSLEDREATMRGAAVSSPTEEERYLERSALLRTSQASYPHWLPDNYAVQEGDTLSTLAARFNLDERTIVWANDSLIQHPDQLSIGQQLVILPLDAAYHTVAEGETLQAIAGRYLVPPETILAYKGNAVTDSSALVPGSKLVIPGASLPDVPAPTPVPKVASVSSGSSNANEGQTLTANPDGSQQGSGTMMWPLDGLITQTFHSYHLGIDIHTPAGRPVVAADDGTVVLVSWMTYSYGYHIIVDHGGGIETLYAHLSEIEVEVGQAVTKGTEIGKVGSTGRSTGPHLHFEVRESGSHRNPFNYLP